MPPVGTGLELLQKTIGVIYMIYRKVFIALVVIANPSFADELITVYEQQLTTFADDGYLSTHAIDLNYDSLILQTAGAASLRDEPVLRNL